MLHEDVSQAALGAESLSWGPFQACWGWGKRDRAEHFFTCSGDHLNLSSHTGCRAGPGNDWTIFELEDVIGRRRAHRGGPRSA
jgi:hypothetical protein